jgi:hypothetical protein
MSNKPKIIVDTHGSENAPAAAEFSVGAMTQDQIQDAINRRNEQAENATDPAELAKRHV